MKLFNDLIVKNEKSIPRKTEENADTYIDWSDFNYPEFFPLIHYKPEEIKNEDKASFVAVY